MKIVATSSLPAVDRPNADHWNAARSCQLKFTMPPFTIPSHSDQDASILSVCAVCWRKNKSMGRVSDKLADLIRKHVFKDFSTQNTYLPRVICDGCRKTITDIEKVGNYGRLVIDFQHIIYVNGKLSKRHLSPTSPYASLQPPAPKTRSADSSETKSSCKLRSN